MLANYREQIEDLTDYIRALGHESYVALEYANWHLGGDTNPREELQHDFQQIDESDALIALLEERISAGVQLEKGYAYAKGKKIYVYQMGTPAWSNDAFSELAGHEIVTVASEAEFIKRAKVLVDELTQL